MRLTLRLIFLCALAIAIGLLLTYPWGSAVVELKGYRFEFRSLGGLFALWLASIFIGHWLLSASALVQRFWHSLRGFRQERKLKKSRSALRRAGLALFEGRYQDAEEDAKKGFQDETMAENKALAYLIAARAAGLQQLSDAKPYLDHLASLPEHLQTGRYLLEAELALDARDAQGALNALNAMPKQNKQPLAVQKTALYAHLILKHDAEILRLTDLLSKANTIPKEACYRYRQDAYARMLGTCMDMEKLQGVWKEIARAEQSPSLWRTRIDKALEFGQLGAAADLIYESGPLLLGAGQFHMANTFKTFAADLSSSDRLRLLKEGEVWLNDHPRHADLLLAMGYLADKQELWGKAQSYFEASLSIHPSQEAYIALGDLKTKLNDEIHAQECYQKAARLAQR